MQAQSLWLATCEQEPWPQKGTVLEKAAHFRLSAWENFTQSVGSQASSRNFRLWPREIFLLRNWDPKLWIKIYRLPAWEQYFHNSTKHILFCSVTSTTKVSENVIQKRSRLDHSGWPNVNKSLGPQMHSVRRGSSFRGQHCLVGSKHICSALNTEWIKVFGVQNSQFRRGIDGKISRNFPDQNSRQIRQQ